MFYKLSIIFESFVISSQDRGILQIVQTHFYAFGHNFYLYVWLLIILNLREKCSKLLTTNLHLEFLK